MSRTRDHSGDIVEGDVIYWLADPEMRFAYGVKYLRFNRETNIITPIGWSGERMGPDADLGPLVRQCEAEKRGKRED
jgi:hypothetical protein